MTHVCCFLIAVLESVLLAYCLGPVIPYHAVHSSGWVLPSCIPPTVASIVFVRLQVELCGIVFT